MKNKKVIREREGEKKPSRFFSKNQEKAVAKNIGGKRQPNSGATVWAKGDVSTDDGWLIECKTKMSKSSSISIQEEWLKKIEHEALFMGKQNTALAFNFGPDECNYYIISEELFIQLKNLLQGE